MAYRIDFHPEAESEFDESLAWYQQQKEGLEQDFFDEYLALEQRLAEAPLQFPVILENIRRANFVAFPYSIFFAVEGESIFIYAVFHQKRDPLDWEARL
ncbi:MAG: type II toxin-antitoxin system RelE/ParE family toxin [Saprospiraceae bacterium]